MPHKTETHCIACNSTTKSIAGYGKDVIHKTTKKIFTLVRCKGCGLVFLDPQPNAEELKTYYPAEYRPHRAPASNHSVYIKPEHPTKRILDVGCGSGEFLSRIATKEPNWECLGTDVNSQAVTQARAKGFDVFLGTLEQSGYKNDSFDIIFMNHVLEHVPNPLETLKKANAILKPGGSIQLLLPNYQSASRILFHSYWYGLDVPRHLYHFTPSTITNLLRNAGFTTTAITFHPSPKSFLFSISYMLFGSRPRVPKVFWHILSPAGRLTALCHLSSVMEVKAEKTR